MRLALAIRTFLRVLLDAEFAARIGELAHSESSAAARPPAGEPQRQRQPQPASARSDAVSLLETLQREARLVDIVMEPLEQYSDAQIGAAARDVLRDCQKALQRIFELQPVVPQQEGDEVEIPADYAQGRYRLQGAVSGKPPYQGKIVHSGWAASRCELPQWAGDARSALIVAPAEVDVK